MELHNYFPTLWLLFLMFTWHGFKLPLSFLWGKLSRKCRHSLLCLWWGFQTTGGPVHSGTCTLTHCLATWKTWGQAPLTAPHATQFWFWPEVTFRCLIRWVRNHLHVLCVWISHHRFWMWIRFCVGLRHVPGTTEKEILKSENVVWQLSVQIWWSCYLRRWGESE